MCSFHHELDSSLIQNKLFFRCRLWTDLHHLAGPISALAESRLAQRRPSWTIEVRHRRASAQLAEMVERGTSQSQSSSSVASNRIDAPRDPDLSIANLQLNLEEAKAQHHPRSGKNRIQIAEDAKATECSIWWDIRQWGHKATERARVVKAEAQQHAKACAIRAKLQKLDGDQRQDREVAEQCGHCKHAPRRGDGMVSVLVLWSAGPQICF